MVENPAITCFKRNLLKYLFVCLFFFDRQNLFTPFIANNTQITYPNSTMVIVFTNFCLIFALYVYLLYLSMRATQSSVLLPLSVPLDE